jgi:DNA polymerase-3 subunit gamma/tau
VVAVSSEPGEPTLAAQEAGVRRRREAEIAAHPLVRAVIETFPGAAIEAIRDLSPAIDTPTDGEPEA